MSVFSFLLVSISSPRISFFCIYILFQHSSVDISISSQWNRYQREPKQDEFLWLVCYCLFAICCRWKQVRAFHRVVSNETLLHPCCWFYECVCARARVCDGVRVWRCASVSSVFEGPGQLGPLLPFSIGRRWSGSLDWWHWSAVLATRSRTCFLYPVALLQLRWLLLRLLATCSSAPCRSQRLVSPDLPDSPVEWTACRVSGCGLPHRAGGRGDAVSRHSHVQQESQHRRAQVHPKVPRLQTRCPDTLQAPQDCPRSVQIGLGLWFWNNCCTL